MKVSCGVFIHYENKFILVKSVKNNYWGIPKGKLIKGENKKDCASREVHEETNIYINVNALYKILRTIHNNRILYVYSYKVNDCYDLSNLILAENEICDIKWFTFDDIEYIETSTQKSTLLKIKTLLSNNNKNISF